MRISLLCSDEQHPVIGHLKKWIIDQREFHSVELLHEKKDLSGGDILFLLSCSEFINETERSSYRFTLVIHASDLPDGRGWSPHIWQLLAGANEITVTLLEAVDEIDGGPIWKKIKIAVPKDALWYEMNELLFNAEIELMDFAIKEMNSITPVAQEKPKKSTTYRKRCPQDSEIDPTDSLASQFDKIRVCDPVRFPAFFKLHGKTFKLLLEKIDD